jgi:two-component system CheB/CheR fusion protein
MPATPPRQRRILVVEDNPEIGEYLVVLLRGMGQKVELASDGSTALELAHRFRPNMVFLDIGLPDMDGFAVAQALRREPGNDQLRIVALTAFHTDEYRRRAIQAGCDLHLVKPLDARLLSNLL